jgi:AraC family transcriptional regulator, transcriptional activator of pobA
MTNAFTFSTYGLTEEPWQQDIQVTAIHLEHGRENCSIKHTQYNYEIIWVQEGSGAHIVNQTCYQLLPGRVYCAIPGQRHQLQTDAGSEGYIISFTEALFKYSYNEYNSLHEENFFQHLVQSPGLPIDSGVAEDIQNIIPLLIKETKNKKAFSTELAIKYLKILLLHIQRQLDQGQASIPKNNNLTRRFNWLLENNFREKKAVAQYAKDLFITPNHLNRVLKEFTGFSARQLIQQRIIREAKKKACERGTSMKEIAYDLGFTDIAHFSKYFKNTSGINFSSFKKNRQTI